MSRHYMTYDPWELLEIAETTGAPDTQPANSDNWCADVTFNARDGWKVVIFYDCGDLDYISHFITPDGEEIDFWDWPESEAQTILRSWRSIGDLARMRVLPLSEW